MRLDYPPQLIHPTPDEVLALLREMHRHNAFAYPDVALSHETTIEEWREADDLAGWRRIARAWNAYWHVNIPLPDWQNALTPTHTRRLRDVCELLARHIRLPRIRPAHLLGTPCAPAGAFLTIRSYLAADGVDVDDLAPSTPLAPYLRRYTNIFLGPISPLAPGILPEVQIHAPFHKVGCGLLFIALLFTLFIALDGSPMAAALAPAIFVCFFCAFAIAACLIRPARVTFPGLHTFRDLATALANP